MNTHTRTIPEWLTGDRVGTIVSPTEAAELPIGTYVVRNLTEVYRVTTDGGMRYPLSIDPAGRRSDLFGLALDAALKVVSVPGLRVDRRCLDELPEGAVVTDRDGDLWTAVEVDGERGWVHTYDSSDRRWVYTYDSSDRRVVEGSVSTCSSTALVGLFGPITGTDLVPGSCATPTVTGDLPTDPDTADDSLDLDDLYRSPVDTVVVDSDGDLWRRQVAREGSKVWVLVVDNGVARPFDTPAAAVASDRLNLRFGPIAYAPAEDAKAALALTPRYVGSVLGGGDPAVEPEHALNEYDADLDPDAVVEAALNRARVALTGDGEHVEVTITRDADGKVRVRTAVTGEVEP